MWITNTYGSQEEEEEYLAPGAVYQVRFVETAGYVDIETNTHPHTLRKSFCPQALQGLHNYRCLSAAAVLDWAQVEGAVAVLCALLLPFSAPPYVAGDEYYTDGYRLSPAGLDDFLDALEPLFQACSKRSSGRPWQHGRSSNIVGFTDDCFPSSARGAVCTAHVSLFAALTANAEFEDATLAISYPTALSLAGRLGVAPHGLLGNSLPCAAAGSIPLPGTGPSNSRGHCLRITTNKFRTQACACRSPPQQQP